MQNNAAMSGLMHKQERNTGTGQRLVALIEAAEAVFLQKGYHNTTMNDVAKAAGISKKTVYELVDSKADLFLSILAHHQAQLTFPVPEPGWSVADTLTVNLLCIARFLLAPSQIALIRLVMAEFTHSPDFARVYLRSRLAKSKSKLEDALIGIAREQGVPTAEAKEGSAMLFGMALGEFHIGTLIGFRAPPTRQALETRVRRAVDVFLAGCGAPPSPTALTPRSTTCGAPPPDA